MGSVTVFVKGAYCKNKTDSRGFIGYGSSMDRGTSFYGSLHENVTLRPKMGCTEGPEFQELRI